MYTKEYLQYFSYKEFNEQQSILSLACKIWPLRVFLPTFTSTSVEILEGGGDCKILFKLDLKDCKESACCNSNGRLFQALMVDGKKELK